MILQVKIQAPSLTQTGAFTKLLDRKIEVENLDNINYSQMVDSLRVIYPDDNVIISFNLFT